jgi:predicted hotdog family 3-hydroxylacyl-ACP dehydratase
VNGAKSGAPIDKQGIAARIPHAGTMCVLDGVIAWDSKMIVCEAVSHTDPGNPLRAGGGLPGIAGIEYAAQAMAMHGSLTGGGGRPTAGYLASVRDVVCSVERLDLLQGALIITAELLIAEGKRVIYRFHLTCSGQPVLHGRAAVVIDAGLSE